MKIKKPKLFDVVVYEVDDRRFYCVVGKAMPRREAAGLRAVFTRMLTEWYGAAVVPAGKFAKGDYLPAKYS